MMWSWAAPDSSAPRHVLVSQARGELNEWANTLSASLEPRGVRVHRATTGPEAIDIVERGRIDVALLSADSPRIDGLGVLRIIRTVRPALPSALIVAEADRWTLQQALELQAMSVFTRPVNLELVTRFVERLFDRLDHEPADRTE